MKVFRFFRNNIFGILASCILGMMVSFFTGWNLFLMLGLFVLLYFAGLIAVVKIRKLITMVKYKNYNVDPDRKEADKIIKNVKNDFLLDLENDEK